jgi:hypothetical protein
MHRNCVALCLWILAGFTSALGRPQPSAASSSSTQVGRIHRHSKVYIAPMGGFETTFFAALDKEIVPLVIVQKPQEAEFEIRETGEKRVTWARMIFASQPLITNQPEIVVTSLRSGEAVLVCPVQSISSAPARQRTAENCAKLLKHKVLEK